MILLSQDNDTDTVGPDELIFVNPHSIETVETSPDGGTSIVRLASGKMLIVAEDRDEIVEMIEQDVPRKHHRR